MKRGFTIIGWAFTVFVILWLAASFNEVIENNSVVGYEYSQYNVFVIFSNLLEYTFCS